MNTLSNGALALVEPIWREGFTRACDEFLEDTSPRMEQLLHLANIIHLMTNKPSASIDPQHETMDWAVKHVFMCHHLINEVVYTYEHDELLDLAAAAGAAALAIYAALEKQCVGNAYHACFALAAMAHFYWLP